MDSVVILQARTNSQRLPGKVLLPIAGLPLVVLSAKRAANTGRRVIVATSVEETDDELAKTLQFHGISVFRGDLNDVLHRFVAATEDCTDDTIVFRLTADNIVPDGHLLDEMETVYSEQHLHYLRCGGEDSGLPYGISVEAINLGILREADKNAKTAYEREHVTPYVVQNCRKRGTFTRYRARKLSHYRATVDCLDDYLLMAKVFRSVPDPIDERFSRIVDQLTRDQSSIIGERPVPSLVLGTAQLGLDYGINNKTGKPGDAEARRIVKSAIENGIAFVDTARAYGTSEAAIGAVVSEGWKDRAKIVTKLSPLADCPDGASPATAQKFVDASIFESLSALHVDRLDTVLVHRARHIKAWGGVVWDRLKYHQGQGKIGSLGVSVQDPGELADVLACDAVKHVQLPFNILDHRWVDSHNMIENAKRQNRIIFHVRGAFMQGLLLSRDSAAWKTANVPDTGAVWAWLDGLPKRFQRDSLQEVCIAYVRGIPWVDGVVIGIETYDQLQKNIGIFQTDPLGNSEIAEIDRTRPELDQNTLRPDLWMK